MRWFRRLLFILLVVGVVWFFYGDEYKENGITGIWNAFDKDIQEIKEKPSVQKAVDSIHNTIGNIYASINHYFSDEEDRSEHDKPDLNQPKEQSFSIYNIEINDDKTNVVDQFGEPNRSSVNEYGVKWHTYHEGYHNFMMIAYNDKDKVAGLFTNQDLLTSSDNISFSSTKKEVRKTFGEPMESIRKGLVMYRFNANEEQDTFLLDNNYITIFYDIHQDNKVTAVQIITKDAENQKQEYFAESSRELAKGLEYQLFDLTNATRIKFDLPILEWYEPSKKISRNHSKDMAENNYFSHQNLDGESPFDRLTNGDISFHMAGENLASGQPSSIFAHQGLMNSKGHRKNILKSDFRLMSVGVAFQDNNKPYYTETFLSK